LPNKFVKGQTKSNCKGEAQDINEAATVAYCPEDGLKAEWGTCSKMNSIHHALLWGQDGLACAHG